jgi:hypothetical protein
MPKHDLHTSEHLLKLETERYEEAKAATRKILIEKNAPDLLPMLGLEEEQQ